MLHSATRRTLALVAAAPLSIALLTACGDDSVSVTNASAPATGAATTSTAASSEASSSQAPSTSSAAPTTTTPSTAAAPATGSRDPGQILRTSKTSANQAKSAHVSGDVVEDGEKMHIDARGQIQTSNQEVTVKTATDGTITIRTISGTHYVKGDRTYWIKQGAPTATANKYAGKYIKAPADKAASFNNFTMKKLISDMTDGFDDSRINSVNTTVTSKQVGTQAALQLAPRFAAETTNITVVDDAKRLPLEITSKEGKVALTEWDAVPSYTAPPASQQVKVPGGA
ncbi:hypothetical protein [Luteipulveratus halotolerans]|uniref:hypothetical protein n=1 Tax=Luteipulveratus halotolerans TaxID=1631356 RepID=UPI0006824496|nr:hypothetical protein [Luteipulveratus halotolerans]